MTDIETGTYIFSDTRYEFVADGKVIGSIPREIGDVSVSYKLDGMDGKFFMWAGNVKSPSFLTVNECWAWVQGYAACVLEKQKPPA